MAVNLRKWTPPNTINTSSLQPSLIIAAAALELAELANVACIVETSSGLQISGKPGASRKNTAEDINYLVFEGPTSLAYAGIQLEGQGVKRHPHGFSSPIGELAGEKPHLSNLSHLSTEQLIELGIEPDKTVTLNFISGILVRGFLVEINKRTDTNILLTFCDCTVTDADNHVLFDPSWGFYDMAVGAWIHSVRSVASNPDTSMQDNDNPEESIPLSGPDQLAKQQFAYYCELQSLLDHPQQRPEAAIQLCQEVVRLENPHWLVPYLALKLSGQQAPRSDLSSTLLHLLQTQTGAASPAAKGLIAQC